MAEVTAVVEEGSANDIVTYLGYANHRAKLRRFGIKRSDRFSHVHIIGRTGTGKSTLMEQMVLQDVAHGDAAVILIDPHGDLARSVRDKVRAQDQDRVVFLDGANPEWTFNPLARVHESQHPLAVAALVSVFARQWEDSWGPRVEHLLRNCLFVLLLQSNATLADIPRLLDDRRLQRRYTSQVKNEAVRDFFLREWPSYSRNFKAAMAAPLLNKIGALISDPRLKQTLCGDHPKLRLAKILRDQRVLLVDLSKGRLGEAGASVLGSTLLAYVALSGLARSENEPVFVYVDELGSVASSFVASMLEELRKRHIGLTVAHQHLAQLGPELRDAVVGNAGTRIVFRVGAQDAELLARELDPAFSATDVLNLPNYNLYLRLLIDGQPSKPFSASTFASFQEAASQTRGP